MATYDEEYRLYKFRKVTKQTATANKQDLTHIGGRGARGTWIAETSEKKVADGEGRGRGLEGGSHLREEGAAQLGCKVRKGTGG